GKYPDDIVSRLSPSTLEGTEIISVDADRLASEAGNKRSVNMVMAGILSKFTDIEESEWFASIDEIFPGKLREINRNAFLMGRNI
ncbi:indolepyruvate oxidoreductase subunit beta, partial [Candidatus Nomurabacteria bacterium]|nr:indolepyruvate oxidoreductase subunit beta [Candidatus Nomurabacteria bacterium]